MTTITIEGKVGKVSFIPSHISRTEILKIERELKKIFSISEDYMSVTEMRKILKRKDPLIGTPGGTIRAYRAREGLTQFILAKKSKIRQGHLSEMERNKRPIGVKVARKLAKVLKCDYRRFL